MTALRLGARAPEPNRAEIRVSGPVWLQAVLFLAAIYLLGVIAVRFATGGSPVALWWPAAGVAVAALLLSPRRWRWGICGCVVLAGALANYTEGRAPLAALSFGLANAAEAAVVVSLLTRGVGGRPSLRTQEDLARLLGSTFVGSLVIGVAAGLIAHFELGAELLPPALMVMAGHGASIVVIAPLALKVDRPRAAGTRQESLVQWAALLATTVLVFSPGQDLALAFLPLPILVWAALRLGIRTVSLQLVVVGVLTAVMSARGWGPFATAAQDAPGSVGAGTLEQAFLIACTLIALPLAVAVEQRASALVRVSASEELFRKSFSESLVGMVLLRHVAGSLQIAELNDTAAEILGGTARELEGQSWNDKLVASDSLDDAVGQMLSGRSTGWREELGLTADRRRRVIVSLSPLSDQGEVPVFSAQMIDVTAAHEASELLRAEKNFTTAVLGTAGCLILVIDVEGVIVGMNPAAEQATGQSDAAVAGRVLWDALVPAEERGTLRALFASDRGVPPSYEGSLLSSRGGRRQVVWSSAHLRDEWGAPTHVVMSGIDVTEQRTTQRLMAHVLRSASGISMIGMDHQGTITFFSAGAERMLGYTLQETVSTRSLQDIHDLNEVAARAAEIGVTPPSRVFFAGVDRTGEPETRDWTQVRKDGSRFTVSLTVSAMKDALGQHIGYLGVGEDVTEQRRSSQTLLTALDKEREAVDRLRELDQTKSDFVSTVSHELRTPITSIIGYTEMLQDGFAGEISPEQDRLVDVVRRNGERLITLVEDLLTLSNIETGTFEAEMAPTDLREVMIRAQEALAPFIRSRLLDTIFEVPDLPVPVLGDAGQLERVMFNLLSNAVKFTEDGGRIRCSLNGSGGQALFEVSDTGIGIPADEQSELFSRFFRSSTSKQRHIQGTGLGLSIVASIVHSHGGDIAVRSAHQAGTTFTVTLPLDAPNEPLNCPVGLRPCSPPR